MRTKSLLWMSSLSLAFAAGSAMGQIAINQAAVLAGSITPGDSPGYPATLGASGSYILTGNLDVSVAAAGTNGINITANDVVLDMNGYTITDKNTCTKSVYGNTCGASPNTEILINVTGSRVTIFNGGIRGSYGTGIRAGESGRLDRLSVSNNQGNGIECDGEICVELTNSSSMLNGRGGFIDNSFRGGARITNSNFDYNYSGAEIAFGTLFNVTASANTAYGFSIGDSTVVNSNAFDNGGDGFTGSGVFKDSVATGNIGDGFNSVSVSSQAVYFNDRAVANSAKGFDMDSTDCYSNVTATGNTTQISGGVALTGTHVTCP